MLLPIFGDVLVRIKLRCGCGAKMFSDEQIKKYDIDTLKKWVRQRLGGYVVMLADITTDNLFYRGVPWAERPTKIDQLSYPPVYKAKQGRANRAEKPLFYCSLAPTAPFPELRVKPGDQIALSEWKVKEPLWMHNLGYHQAALHKIGSQNLTMRQRLISPIKNESRANAKLRGELSLAFTKDIKTENEHHYKLSIAINEMLYDNASPLPKFPNGPRCAYVAATVYPAMHLRGDADNVAIRPEFVDSSLELKSVRYILVEAVDEGRPLYTLRTIAFANAFSGGDIIWQDQPLPEKRNRSHFYLEKDAWFLRDDFGNIIDVH
jgi:hypothetical protein